MDRPMRPNQADVIRFGLMVKMLWRQLLRFGFWLLYNPFAWSYDLVSWSVSLGQWRSWQRTAFPFLHGRDLLEIGHGPGHLLLELRQMGYRLVAVDLSPFMGRLAARRLQRAGVVVPLLRGRAEQLPLATAAFDTVLATFPAPFIFEAATLAAVRRVLRPDGRFVIVLAAEQVGRRPLQRLVSWLFRLTGQGSLAPTDKSEPELPPRLMAAFAAAGFSLTGRYVRLPTSRVLILSAHRSG
jgi:SAM-dependent methyltransferase